MNLFVITLLAIFGLLLSSCFSSVFGLGAVNFTSAPFTTSPSNDSSNCDYSSYPDFCIPPPPPSLNCDDVDGKDFTVFLPDPHGFDRDHDGEGCETSE